MCGEQPDQEFQGLVHVDVGPVVEHDFRPQQSRWRDTGEVEPIAAALPSSFGTLRLWFPIFLNWHEVTSKNQLTEGRLVNQRFLCEPHLAETMFVRHKSCSNARTCNNPSPVNVHQESNSETKPNYRVRCHFPTTTPDCLIPLPPSPHFPMHPYHLPLLPLHPPPNPPVPLPLPRL